MDIDTAKPSIDPTIENLRTIGAEPMTNWLIEAAKERHTIT